MGVIYEICMIIFHIVQYNQPSNFYFIFSGLVVNLACRGDYNVFPNQVKCRRKTPTDSQLGMISHKKSLITIFGHKHKIKNVIKKFDIFH